MFPKFIQQITSTSFLKKFIFYISFIASFWLSTSHQTQLLGLLTLTTLSVVIFTKPLVRLFPGIPPFKTILAVRRELGIASAFFLFGHVYSQVFPTISLLDILGFGLNSSPKDFLFWGFWAFVLMLPLFLTSNDLSTRLLKRNWFRLHKLIHPLYVFALIHYALQGDNRKRLFVIGVLVTLYSLRYLASKNVVLIKTPTPPSV